MSEKYRYYKNKKTIVHKRKETWFDSPEKEKVYEENFIRIKSENDLSVFVKPKPKPKPKPKAKKKAKKKK